MKNFFNFLIGIAIGAGAILPGISSGVICVLFGIYEKLLDCVLNLFKDFKKNFRFLFPIILGIGCGFLILGNILNYVFYSYNNLTKSLFVGLILGTVPSLFNNVYNQKNFRLRFLLFTIISFSIGVLTVWLEKVLPITSLSNMNYIYFVICGFIMSIGIVVPGVSSTIILMLLGVYSIYLSSVSSMYLPVLIPMGIGILLGSIFFMKVTKYLLDKFYTQTFCTIIGFSLGSIFVLLPNITFNFEGFIGILLAIIGFWIGKLI